MSAPFRQLPFDDLPATPRRPHGFFALELRRTSVHTRHFGPVEVAWRKHGEGPPLLLVHGLMTSGYSWRYVLDDLGRHFTLYIPDLPGAGRSDKPDVPYTPDALARFLGAFQAAVGIHGCPAIGNSLGGYLCMRLALLDPNALSRLVNLHSPGIPLPRLYALKAALSLPGSAALLRWMVQRDPRRWAHRNVHYYDESLKSLEEAEEYGAPLATDDGLAAFRRALHETLDPAEMRAFTRLLRVRREAKRRFPVPLMLVYARQDPMVPPEVGEGLAALVPDAVFARLKEGSHFAHVDAPEHFLPPALDFLGVR